MFAGSPRYILDFQEAKRPAGQPASQLSLYPLRT
jgi:hypothetical protein